MSPQQRLIANARLRQDRAQAAMDFIRAERAKLAEEARHGNDKEGLSASFAMLQDILRTQGVGYDQFVFSTVEQAA